MTKGKGGWGNCESDWHKEEQDNTSAQSSKEQDDLSGSTRGWLEEKTKRLFKGYRRKKPTLRAKEEMNIFTYARYLNTRKRDLCVLDEISRHRDLKSDEEVKKEFKERDSLAWIRCRSPREEREVVLDQLETMPIILGRYIVKRFWLVEKGHGHILIDRDGGGRRWVIRLRCTFAFLEYKFRGEVQEFPDFRQSRELVSAMTNFLFPREGL